MFRNGLQLSHILIILVVVLLLFGANRLPGLARSVGQSMKIFKNEVKDLADDDRRDAGTTTSTTATGTVPDVGTGTVPGVATPAPDPAAGSTSPRSADTPPDASTPPRA